MPASGQAPQERPLIEIAIPMGMTDKAGASDAG